MVIKKEKFYILQKIRAKLNDIKFSDKDKKLVSTLVPVWLISICIFILLYQFLPNINNNTFRMLLSIAIYFIYKEIIGDIRDLIIIKKW
jgi:uncharacterized BrkB/YihY/UPF0761 family membrane protein